MFLFQMFTRKQKSVSSPDVKNQLDAGSLLVESEQVNSILFKQLLAKKTDENSERAIPIDKINDTSEDSYLFNLIPYELLQMMKEAAQRGLFVSFLLTLSDDFVINFLRTRHYKPEYIYWINQAIRNLTILAVGASMPANLATPLINYLLTHHLGVNEKMANYITRGSIFACRVLGSTVGVVETSVTLLTAMGGAALGTKVGHQVYDFLQHKFFTAKEPCDGTLPEKTRQMNLSMV